MLVLLFALVVVCSSGVVAWVGVGGVVLAARAKAAGKTTPCSHVADHDGGRMGR
jgi:hypothetical protein